ncbi:MAG: phosphotransferase family protein [Eubacterium sp.]|nr:phosphotransferase family protein [Eubacterium sp.]
MYSEVRKIICRLMNVKAEEISDLKRVNEGMTNCSYEFRCNNEHLIIRIPGEGTENIINRIEEAAVYYAISGRGFSEELVYLGSGYKISKFIENTHVCDPKNKEDVILALKAICNLHDQRLKVDHRWDTYETFDRYDSMWRGKPSMFKDYEEVKKQIMGLQPFIEEHTEEIILTHIDPVNINVLITNDPINPKPYLIDWEYAAMFDPHLDIVSFGLFANYDKTEMDWLIDKYFEIRNQKPSYDTITKIYAYIATFGLLWTSWSEAKRYEGVDFTDYEKTQYKYAKEYLNYVQERLIKKSA